MRQSLLANKVKKISEIERFNVGLHNHAFMFVAAFPLGRVAGATVLGGPEIPHDQQHSQKVILKLVHGNVIPMGIPWETSHGMGWDRHKLQCDRMGMGQINMSHGQP